MTEDPWTAPLQKAGQQGMRSSLVGIASNLVLAIFKCTAGLLGHSFALVADGVESLSGVISSTMVYFGLRFAIKPPDEDHPYGHGKAEPIAAIAVGLALIVAAVFIGMESVTRIREPHPLPLPYTLWVLLAVAGVKIILSRYVSAVGAGLESSAVESDAWHHLSDAITSGFALIGISLLFGHVMLQRMIGRLSARRRSSSLTRSENSDIRSGVLSPSFVARRSRGFCEPAGI